MDRDEKRIDEMLDAGLAGYADVEPRAGLEGRILARLSGAAAEPERSGWLRWWPAWGLSVAAVIVLIVILSVPKHSAPSHEVVVKENPKAIEASVPPKQPQVARTTGHRVQVLLTHVDTLKPQPVAPQLSAAKQDVFPAPSPLSDQERMLLTYVRRTPATEIAANSKPDPLPEIQMNQLLPGLGTTKTDQNSNTR